MSLGVPAEQGRVTAELRAMAHPLRLRMLSLLTGATMTAAEVARELHLTHANASYHLRQLAAVGLIEVAGEENIRGGAAKRYRYVVESTPRITQDGEAPSAPDPPQLAQRRAVYLAVAGELRRRSAFARHSPGRSHMTDADLWVTPADWTEVEEIVQAASIQLHRAAQPARTPGTIRINATLAMFEMEPDA